MTTHLLTPPTVRPHSHRSRAYLRGVSAVLAAAGVLSLAACGSDDGTGATAPRQKAAVEKVAAGSQDPLAAEPGTIDPCGLLTADEIGTLLGGADVTVAGPATEAFRGRECRYTFPQPDQVIDQASVSVDTWHGAGFFVPGTIGAPLDGVGKEAQEDAEHGIVLFRKGDDVVQVHVLSTSAKRASLDIAAAAAAHL